jgi:hypothetical protein
MTSQINVFLFVFLFFLFYGLKKCNTEYPHSVYFEFSAFKTVTLRIHGVTYIQLPKQYYIFVCFLIIFGEKIQRILVESFFF